MEDDPEELTLQAVLFAIGTDRLEARAARAPFTGKSLCHVAAESGAIRSLRTLLDAGCNIDARDKYRDTILHFAAKAGQYDVCSMLLKKGADYNATNKHDANPAVWAEQYGFTAIQALVRKAQAAGDQPEEDPLPPGVTEDLLEDLFLNKSQVMSFWEAFNVFDADNSGSIDTDEFGKTLRGIGYHPSEAEIADCIDEADADGSGALDFLEFIEIMARRIITDEEEEKGYDVLQNTDSP